MPYGLNILDWMSNEILKSCKRDKKKHVKGYVCCIKCKRTGVTLRKISDEYICNDCYKESK